MQTRSLTPTHLLIGLAGTFVEFKLQFCAPTTCTDKGFALKWRGVMYRAKYNTLVDDGAGQRVRQPGTR